jgi:hypothetical protein
MTIMLCLTLLLQADEFGGRLGGKRNLVARGGGTGATEDAVLAALKWLARHASDDGSWSAAKVAERCNRLPKYAAGKPCPADFAAGPGDVVRADEPTDDDRAKLATCADTLASGGLEEREAASRELVALGPRILALLRRRAEDAQEAEVKARLQSVIDKIVRGAEPKGERVAATAAALMVFLGAGYTPLSRDTHDGICFGDVVAKGLEFLRGEQAPDGGWGGCTAEALAMATHALCEAGAVLSDDDFKKASAKAVAALVARQREDGTWPAHRAGDPDPASTVAAAWALHAATWLGADVEKPLDRLRKWAASRQELPKDRAELAAIGTAIVVAERKRTPTLTAIATEAAKTGPSVDESPAVVAALTAVVFHADGPEGVSWKRWNEGLRDMIVREQATHSGGCAAGSWKPPDGARATGRVGAVAQRALALETYYRLPVLAR